ncbi:VOC family protein [Streptomyces sp. NPDC005374]|uniref:VOC family protein n=1 Tax=Streptomyces sp. NPDC005374 TaxID=3364713 RepID=UPI003677DFD4
MAITGLGHAGFWVDDLDTMRDFYTRVMGLSVTDEDEEMGTVFLSARGLGRRRTLRPACRHPRGRGPRRPLSS